MEIIIICIVAFCASLLTFFSGFGLGTILLAVLLIFFEAPVAIAMTGIVHLLNNVFKYILVSKNVDWNIIKKFGIPSIIGALIGALVLKVFNNITPLYEYHIGGHLHTITLLKILLSLIIIFFTFYESLEFFKWKAIEQNMTTGGLISGFFGGLSGHQGALRSAFLVHQNLKKEVFIASGVVIACLVDLTRLPLYFSAGRLGSLNNEKSTILMATLAAFAGAYLGSRLIKKVTIESLQKIVAIFLIIIALMLGTGFI